jgi:mRNA interferase MazF
LSPLFARAVCFDGGLPAEITGLQVDAKTQAEQVRYVAEERLGPALGPTVCIHAISQEALGQLPAALVAALDDALRLQLRL